MRIIARTDSNQAEIVKKLHEAGASVTDLHQLGGGCPDLVIGYHGVTALIEVKQPGGTLTPDEAEWFSTWRGLATVVHSVDEALDFIHDLEAK